MNRRRFMTLAGTTVLGLGFTGLAFGEEKRQKPNFIFILTDDLGWGDLSCYGNHELRTPNIDRLANNGLLFTQAYMCNPVCSPSRAALMTGCFPARHRIHDHLSNDKDFNKQRGMADYLDPDVVTITDILKNNGYVTGHVGKWHLGRTEGAPLSDEYGIEEYELWNAPNLQKDYSEDTDPYYRAKSTERFVDDTIKFIERNKDKPFYVNLWTMLPHAFLHPTDEQMKPYVKWRPPHPTLKRTEHPYEGVKQVYYASVGDIDRQIGQLIKKVDELGLTENTVIVFSSDNGPADINAPNAVHSGIGSTGPFRGRKRSIYEGGIRVPFIVQWKGTVPASKVDDTTVIAGVDWLPTICTLAGAKLPKNLNIDGEDMSQAIFGNPQKRKKDLFWEYSNWIPGHTIHKSPTLAIREGKWKLLMNPDGGRKELYNLEQNACEVDNVADSNPDVVKRLSEKLLAWKKSIPQVIPHETAGSSEYPWPKNR